MVALPKCLLQLRLEQCVHNDKVWFDNIKGMDELFWRGGMIDSACPVSRNAIEIATWKVTNLTIPPAAQIA